MWEQCQWQELAGSGGRCCWMLVQVPAERPSALIGQLCCIPALIGWHWPWLWPLRLLLIPGPCHARTGHWPTVQTQRTYIWLIPGHKSTSEIYFQICDCEIFIKLAGIQNCRIDSGKVFSEESRWVSSTVVLKNPTFDAGSKTWSRNELFFDIEDK